MRRTEGHGELFDQSGAVDSNVRTKSSCFCMITFNAEYADADVANILENVGTIFRKRAKLAACTISTCASQSARTMRAANHAFHRLDYALEAKQLQQRIRLALDEG